MKLKKRSRLRMLIGKCLFTCRRYFQWYLPGRRYASEQLHPAEIPQASNLVFRHETLLLRKLRNVDMWLQYNKIHNLKLAIPELDGLILRPGETMSYWKLIGRPSKRRGYLEGMELVDGSFRPGFGGGLCQLSNLIYWMTLHTPLTVTERYRHQYDVFPDADRTQPFGSGATCAYNYVDLQIRNDTEAVYYLHLYLTETHLVGEWRADKPVPFIYEIYEKHHKFTQEHWGGYVRHNQIWRKVFTRAGELVDDVFITENHALMMYSPLLSEGSDAR